VNLYEKFCNALQEGQRMAPNWQLQQLAPTVKKIEMYADLEPLLFREFASNLMEIVCKANFAISSELTEKFVQLFGEAHFALECKKRGIHLQKIPEQKIKTPDFELANNACNFRFEVKTLSVVNGKFGISSNLENALEAKISLESQLKSGKRIAMAESEVSAYGHKPVKDNQSTTVIETLLDKARQNIKAGQFEGGPTFLVLNLCMFTLNSNHQEVLRPVYWADYPFPTPVSGDLWMLAFGKPGMLVFGRPEFEGKSSIEGTFQKRGILSDPDFEGVAGIIVMTYSLDGQAELFGLFRENDWDSWEPCDWQVVTSIVDDFWNDELDSNGWKLSCRSSCDSTKL